MFWIFPHMSSALILLILGKKNLSVALITMNESTEVLSYSSKTAQMWHVTDLGSWHSSCAPHLCSPMPSRLQSSPGSLL